MNIPITKPYFDKLELSMILEPLMSGWVVQGPYVKKFERLIAEFTGAKYAIALNSCTSGQFLLSEILNLNENDEVIVPAFTWISTANSVEYFGAKVVFCDIDIETFNIDIDEIKKKITKRTKAIYPVNLFGLPSNLTEIVKIAKKYNLKIIEDSACGLGGKIENKHCGTFGNAGIFSFHPRKSITTGEGGMIITDDKEIYKISKSMREHGAVKTDFERHSNKNGFLLTEYIRMGFNYRMTDIQGALGVAQASKLKNIFSIKQKLAIEYNKRLKHINWLKAPVVPKGYEHGYQAYCTIFKYEETLKAIKNRDINLIDKLNEERNKIMQVLEKDGIATRQGTHSVHIQNYYKKKYNYKADDFISAYAADKLSIALPFYPSINDDEKDYVFSKLRRIKI